MSQFTVSQPSWWNSTEKPKSPPKHYHDAKHLGLKLPDLGSFSSQSTGQSLQEGGAMGNSQEQSISSESGQDESCGRDPEGQMKPALLLSNPDTMLNLSQVNLGQSMARAPYPYVEPYYGGLYAAYEPQTMIQPQIVGMAPARVPLPLELSEDGPIYVNAKQYHGILRRRESRAKLEAPNKLVKSRKPYLHESRHLHALNRVRGGGGRFTSTKKLQQHDATSTSHRKNTMSEFGSRGSGSGKHAASSTSSVVSTASYSDVIFQQPDNNRFSSFSIQMDRSIQDNIGGLQKSVPCFGFPVRKERSPH